MRRIRVERVLLLVAVLLAFLAYNVRKAEVAVGYQPTPADSSNIDTSEPLLPVNETQIKEATVLDVPVLCQYPELPTGCESTAAVMALQYYGETVTPEEFADLWLEKSEDFYLKNGVNYGPDPAATFVGDPFSVNGFGCYASVIAAAINGNSTLCTAQVLEGKTLEQLCEEYIDEGQPIVLWATSEMRVPKEGRSWRLPSGEDFTWISGEHCLVLVGYDASYYYFNDPRQGDLVCYKRSTVESRYEALGSQAVLVTPQ